MVVVALNDVIFTPPCVIGAVDNVISTTSFDSCAIVFKLEEVSCPISLNAEYLSILVLDWCNVDVNGVVLYPLCVVGAVKNAVLPMLADSCDISF